MSYGFSYQTLDKYLISSFIKLIKSQKTNLNLENILQYVKNPLKKWPKSIIFKVQ